jgi:hypothetical protein
LKEINIDKLNGKGELRINNEAMGNIRFWEEGNLIYSVGDIWTIREINIYNTNLTNIISVKEIIKVVRSVGYIFKCYY